MHKILLATTITTGALSFLVKRWKTPVFRSPRMTTGLSLSFRYQSDCARSRSRCFKTDNRDAEMDGIDLARRASNSTPTSRIMFTPPALPRWPLNSDSRRRITPRSFQTGVHLRELVSEVNKMLGGLIWGLRRPALLACSQLWSRYTDPEPIEFFSGTYSRESTTLTWRSATHAKLLLLLLCAAPLTTRSPDFPLLDPSIV